MKVLLDECLPTDFRHALPRHETHTAQWAGLNGKKNGDLLRAVEVAGYDVLLTVDQGIHFQRQTTGRHLALVLLKAPTNELESLLPLVGPLEWAIALRKARDR